MLKSTIKDVQTSGDVELILLLILRLIQRLDLKIKTYFDCGDELVGRGHHRRTKSKARRKFMEFN
jgi:hypothetical protein